MVAKLTALTLGMLAAVMLTAAPAGAISKCQGSKIKAAGSKAACLLKLESTQASKGIAPPGDKVQKCKTKFSQAYAKADGGNDCVTTGDAVPLEAKVEAFVADVDSELSVGTLPNKCQGSKIKSARKKTKCLLGLEAKSASTGDPVAPDKVTKCRSKFSSGFAKVQAKGPCNTGADRNVIEAKVDAFIDDVLCELGPACTCGGTVEGGIFGFTTAVPGGAPTGQVTPAKCVGGATPGGDCTVDADCGSGCVGGPNNLMACPPAVCTPGVCVPGVCRGHLDRGGLYFGGGVVGVPLPTVVPDYGTTFFRVSCCSGSNMILKKTTAGEEPSITNLTCSATGCKYGAPLPVPNPANPATSTCIINTVSDDALGSGQCVAGDLSINIPLSSAITLVGDGLPKRCSYGSANDNAGRNCTADADCPGGGTCVADPDTQPCPICNPTTLKCNGGTNDVIGNAPVACVPGTLNSVGPQFPTSHDCPPSGFALGALPIPYALTTGTATDTAIDLPAQARVFCGFCFDNTTSFAFKNPPVFCETDVDCTNQAPYTSCQQRNGGAFSNNLATGISETGTPAGNLTDLASHSSVLVSVFCIAPTFNGIVDPAGGLPGPGAVGLPGSAQLFGPSIPTTTTTTATTTTITTTTSTTESTTTTTTTTETTTTT